MTGPAGEGELSLAALSVRQSQLRQEVGRLAGRVAEAEAGIRGQAASVAEAASLAGEVERLAELAGAAGPAARPGSVYPRNWATMSDEDSAKALRYLARWVTTILFATYPHVSEVMPACWPAHAAVVAELDWLCWAWEEVWAVGARPAARDAADWHDRWLPGVLQRVRPLLTACQDQGEHVKPRYTRAVPPEYRTPPPGVSSGEWWPELEFLENMGRAERAEIRRLGGYP